MGAAEATLPRIEQESARPQGERIPVLFIAGAARSGSTLLDRVLGTHDGFVSTGELNYVWHRSFRENQLCGCGVAFHECPFWTQVSDIAFGVQPAQFDAAGADSLRIGMEHTWRVPGMILNWQPRDQSTLHAYAELVQRLYSAILQVSGAQVIVDSSKDPRHGLVLSKVPGVDLHIVHLIRDPRGVAFSWKRVRRRPEVHWKAQNMMVKRAWDTASRWTTYNAAVERLSASAASYCRVRYEDFVAEPSATLSRILAPFEWVGEPQGADGRDIVLEQSHIVAGNPMRFTGGPLSLKLDDEWRRTMPLHERLSVSAATLPLLARYGYHLRGGVGGLKA